MASSINVRTKGNSKRRRKRSDYSWLKYQQHSNHKQQSQQHNSLTTCYTEPMPESKSTLPTCPASISHSTLQCFWNCYEIIPSLVCSTSTKRTCSTALISWYTAYRILAISLIIGILSPSMVMCVDPKFDPSTRMRLVLVPADAQVGSVIYRLRATDEEFDYPLAFEFVGDASSSTVKIQSLPCTKYNSVCQANVVLQRRLEPGRYYDFQVSVKDTKGGMATQLCSITATNFTTPHDLIFPHKPGIIMIPESVASRLCYLLLPKSKKDVIYRHPAPLNSPVVTRRYMVLVRNRKISGQYNDVIAKNLFTEYIMDLQAIGDVATYENGRFYTIDPFNHI